MRLFSCQSCSQILFFENAICERCRHTLGYWPDDNSLHALDPAADSPGDTWVVVGDGQKTFRFCANAQHGVCNWLVDAGSGEIMCAACRHNRVIPELGSPEHRLAWRKIEIAKHRLFYSLYKLGLAGRVNFMAPHEPLVFKFLDDYPNIEGKKVMTGHKGGVITIALAEADDAERELRRKTLGEPYRTLLGHFRHEIGHYIWDRLVRDGNKLAECRAIFGDDAQDYKAALKRHYAQGAPLDWQTSFVSTYATSHPWEDFAETWAHYLHIVDVLEMAKAYDMRLAPSVDKDGEFAVHYDLDPHDTPDIQAIVDVWLPVSTALNSMNRAMGKDELYPFILSPSVVTKLGFIHGLVHEAAHAHETVAPETVAPEAIAPTPMAS